MEVKLQVEAKCGSRVHDGDGDGEGMGGWLFLQRSQLDDTALRWEVLAGIDSGHKQRRDFVTSTGLNKTVCT